MMVKELAKILNAKWIKIVDPHQEINSFSIDSRDIQKSDCFIAIKGQNQDGHKFIKDIKRYASCIVVQERDLRFAGELNTNVLYVGNTKESLMRIAHVVRKQKATKTIAITGSCGKTSTKELLSHVLSKVCEVNTSPYSFNNDIGVSLTLSNLTSQQINVIEVGINKIGEMAELSKIIQPDIVCITMVGYAHLEGLGSIEKIMEEKFNLAKYASKDAICILPIDLAGKFKMKFPKMKVITFGSDKSCDVRLTGYNNGYDICSIGVSGVNYYLKSNGEGMVNSMLITHAVADILKVNRVEVQKAIGSYLPPPLRMQKLVFENSTIIADCYNANPHSCKMAMDYFSRISHFGRKIVVLGSMLEMGESSDVLHEEVLCHAKKLGFEHIILVGKEYKKWKGECSYYEDVKSLTGQIKYICEPNDLVLLKGSRNHQLEKLIPVISGEQFDEEILIKKNSLLEV